MEVRISQEDEENDLKKKCCRIKICKPVWRLAPEVQSVVWVEVRISQEDEEDDLKEKCCRIRICKQKLAISARGARCCLGGDQDLARG